MSCHKTQPARTWDETHVLAQDMLGNAYVCCETKHALCDTHRNCPVTYKKKFSEPQQVFCVTEPYYANKTHVVSSNTQYKRLDTTCVLCNSANGMYHTTYVMAGDTRQDACYATMFCLPVLVVRDRTTARWQQNVCCATMPVTQQACCVTVQWNAPRTTYVAADDTRQDARYATIIW